MSVPRAFAGTAELWSGVAWTRKTSAQHSRSRRVSAQIFCAIKAYYRWWFVNTLLKHSLDQALPLIAETPAANLLLRALGAELIEIPGELV